MSGIVVRLLGRCTQLVMKRTEYYMRSFVRLFVIAGRGPAYSGPQRRDLYVGSMLQPRETRGIGVCVCVCHVEGEGVLM